MAHDSGCDNTCMVLADKGMLWTDDRLRQVIARYTPVLHLHHEEQYLPCSVQWYMERSQLWLEEPVDKVGFAYCEAIACKQNVNIQSMQKFCN